MSNNFKFLKYLLLGILFIVLLPRDVKSTDVSSLPIQKGDILVYQYHAEDQGLAHGITFDWADMSPRGHIKLRDITWYKGEKLKVGVINWEHAEKVNELLDEFSYKVGKTTGDFDRGDHMYCHYVEKIEDVTVPAGTFKNCFKVVELTCPDDSATWYYPGIGVVKYTYHHHGTITHVIGELKEICKNG